MGLTTDELQFILIGLLYGVLMTYAVLKPYLWGATRDERKGR